MVLRLHLALLVFFVAAPLGIARAQTEKVAIVYQGISGDYFSQQLERGCSELAAKEMGDFICDVRPVIAPKPLSNTLRDLIQEGYAAIAVWPVDLDELLGVLADARSAGIPILTFNADLAPQHRDLRLAYFGNDQRELGKLFGKLVRQFAHDGGLVCTLYDPANPAEVNRLRGVRDALPPPIPPDPLVPGSAGKIGWEEASSCPIAVASDGAEAARQVGDILGSISGLRVLVSLTNRSQEQDELYKQAVAPFIPKILSFDLGVFGYGTSKAQEDFLEHGHSSVQVGERPLKLGYDLGYAMKRVLQRKELIVLDGSGKPISKSVDTLQPQDMTPPIGFDVCRRDNAFECSGRSTASQ
ncbi:substrate-binding domain-containing protein [Rhizobium acaciae]|uniref:substrate-binding domain-containing protein n=1 Tax=Rhizobium acaciae TaxID=2989736 RepID=UPI00221FE626|nr:substrate-binding domain-containing protein [Rhizobium acaciae]MCW1750595.1 substrate-binding domain-containing protein [Rhizobium acaciae]